MKLSLHRFVVGPLHTNSYLISAEKESVIIDVGTMNKDEINTIRKHIDERNVVAVFFTHGHPDHLCGAHLIQAESYFIHEKEFEIIYDSLWWARNFYGMKCELPEDLKILVGREKFNLCSTEFEIIHTPGHTPGSICILCREINALFTGDTLFRGGYGRTDFKGGNRNALIDSLKNLCSLDDDLIVYPGHGESTVLLEEKRWIRNL